ncbi:hypothetical protein YC2023_107100 [Brassica napus]
MSSLNKTVESLSFLNYLYLLYKQKRTQTSFPEAINPATTNGLVGKTTVKIEKVSLFILSRKKTDFQQIDGNHIRVDRACPPRKKLKGDHLYDSKRTVFMEKNLSESYIICMSNANVPSEGRGEASFEIFELSSEESMFTLHVRCYYYAYVKRLGLSLTGLQRSGHD